MFSAASNASAVPSGRFTMGSSEGANDERPARHLLGAMLRGWEDVEVVGECSDGAQAVDGADLAAFDATDFESHPATSCRA